MTKVNIILGPPGTGKTTTLLNLIDQNLAKGVAPNKIGFISFTKKATEEARDRAKARFNLVDDDLQYFRTIHSLAFKMLGMNTGSVMKFRDWKEFGNYAGVEIKGRFNVEDGMVQGLEHGDKLIFIEQLSRVRCVPLDIAWRDSAEEDISLLELDQISRALAKWKKVNGKIDYTDMLSRYLDEGYVPDFKVLFIDEAQDLSQLQWRIVNRLMDRAEVVYAAGDDDQAIFRWSGADVDHFINLTGEIKVLDHSYRLPKAIHTLAEGISRNIQNRREKRFNSNESNGYTHYSNSVDDLDLTKGQWMVLVRNGYMVSRIESLCKNRGIFYSFRDKGPDQSEHLLAARAWEKLRKGHRLGADDLGLIKKFTSREVMKNPRFKPSEGVAYDLAEFVTAAEIQVVDVWHKTLDMIKLDDREYLISCLRAGEKLQEPPRVKISTIHGAKGGEAENVALLTDVSFKTHEAMQKDMDDEHRVFYVGATRAKTNLHIIEPETTRYYEL